MGTTRRWIKGGWEAKTITILKETTATERISFSRGGMIQEKFFKTLGLFPKLDERLEKEWNDFHPLYLATSTNITIHVTALEQRGGRRVRKGSEMKGEGWARRSDTTKEHVALSAALLVIRESKSSQRCNFFTKEKQNLNENASITTKFWSLFRAAPKHSTSKVLYIESDQHFADLQHHCEMS